MTKHTPGPWEIYEGGNFVKIGRVGYIAQAKAEHYLANPLCVADVERDTNEDHSPNHALAMANARLIVTAPELLEALIGLLELGRKDLSNPKYDGYFETAQVAARKAQGVTE